MRRRRFALLGLTGMVACTGAAPDADPDAGTVPDGAPVPDGARVLDAAVTVPDGEPDPTVCATPPTGNWQGIARITHHGGGGETTFEAAIVWFPVSTDGAYDGDHFEAWHPDGTGWTFQRID